jgi:hypothetical protein
LADEFAIIRTQAITSGTPGVTTQDFTDAALTSFSAAVFFVYGTTSAGSEEAHARLCAGFVDSNGSGACRSGSAPDGQTSVLSAVTRKASLRCIIVGDPSGTSSGAQVAAAQWSANLSNGVRLLWDVIPDAAYEIVVLLIGGATSTSIDVDSGSSSSAGFEADFVFTLSSNGSFSSTGSSGFDYEPNLGFFCNESGIPQSAIHGEWEGNTSTTDADVIVRNNRAGGEVQGDSETNSLLITAFTATGWTATGATTYAYLAVKLSGTLATSVAVETLPGSSGPASFTGLGIRPAFVIGCANLLTVENTLTDGAGGAVEGLFMFDKDVSFSGCSRMAEGEAISGGNPTDTASIFKTEPLYLMDESGTEAVSTSLTGLSGTGFDLNFSTATAGRMVVFAVEGPVPMAYTDESVNVTETAVVVRGKPRHTDELVNVTETTYTVLTDVSVADDPELTISQAGLYAGQVSSYPADRTDEI